MSPALKKQTEESGLLEPKLKLFERKGVLSRNAWLCLEMVLKEEESLWGAMRVEGNGENREDAINIEFESIMSGGGYQS